MEHSSITPQLRSLLKKAVPPRVRRLVHQASVESLDLLQLWYWNKVRQTRPPIPLHVLRARVGSPGIQSFLRQGRRHVEDLQRPLRSVDRDFGSFGCILEFGCGSGRQTRWLESLAPGAAIYGVDIDKASVAWDNAHLPFASFFANSALPPLPFENGKFDLIFAVSVFTHLNEANQIQWLAELRRVAQPGCTLLLTIHGPHALSRHRQSPEDYGIGSHLTCEGLEKAGFFFNPYPKEFSQDYGGEYGMTYHSHRYINDVWSKYFRLLSILPAGLENHQDILVLTKTPPASNDLAEAN